MALTTEIKDWILRVGDGKHFHRSSKYMTWGLSKNASSKAYFLRSVQKGDHLWFAKSGGQLIAVATFKGHNPRETGPLIAVTLTNQDLGWTETDGDWDTEVHYTDLYNLTACDLQSRIKSPLTIRIFNSDKCKVNLPCEYQNIVRYLSSTTSM